MSSFAALVLAAVLSKVLGNAIFTPLAAGLAGSLLLLRTVLDERRRREVERFLLLFGMLVYALANQDPSYHEHAALAFCLLPSLSRLRQVGHVLRREGSVLVVLALVLVSATWSANLEMSVAGFVMTGLCIAFLVATVLESEGDWTRWLGQVLVVLGAVLVGSFVAGAIGHGSAGRTFAGVTLHRNQLGFLLGLMILLCLFALRPHGRGPSHTSSGAPAPWAALLAGCGAAGLLLYIDSKSSIIAIAFTALVFLVASARHWKLGFGLLLLGMVVFWTALPSPKMDHFALWMGRDPTFTSRTEIWADSLRLAGDQPVTGYGYNAVWSAHENRLAQYPDAPGPRYAHAHNAWIDWTLQLGLGGLAAYGLMLGVLLARAWSRGHRPGGRRVGLQAGALVLYIQVYDLANVSTVPLTRFGFFMLAGATLCLWLQAAETDRQRLKWMAGDGGRDDRWTGTDPAASPRPASSRAGTAAALVLAGLVATTAYALWEDGQRYAATEKRSPPAPNGVAAAGYLDAREFQWKTPQKLDELVRRHREGLLEQMRRSEGP